MDDKLKSLNTGKICEFMNTLMIFLRTRTFDKYNNHYHDFNLNTTGCPKIMCFYCEYGDINNKYDEVLLKKINKFMV